MIPKIIWQTYADDWEDLPEYIKLDCLNWKELNPDWDYRYFNDKDCADFIKKHFPNYFNIYKKIKIPYIRADFWRYLVLYKFGGVYADIDTSLAEPLDFWLETDSGYQFITFDHNDEKYGYSYENWFMAMEPGNIYVKTFIDAMLNGIFSDPGSGDYTINVGHTGPHFLAKTLSKIIDPKTARIIPVQTAPIDHKGGSMVWSDRQEERRTLHDHLWYKGKLEIKISNNAYGSGTASKWQKR